MQPDTKNRAHIYIFASWAIAYSLWDLTILSMYIFKLIIIQRTKSQNKHDAIYQRISYILTKMSILTGFSNFRLFITLIVVGVVVSLVGLNVGIRRVIANIIAMIDQPVSCITIYFMIERNDEEYVKYIGTMWCCKRINQDEKQMNNFTHGDRSDREHKEKSIVTQTIAPQLEIKHYQSNSIQSEV